jgi:hypothetical protein
MNLYTIRVTPPPEVFSFMKDTTTKKLVPFTPKQILRTIKEYDTEANVIQIQIIEYNNDPYDQGKKFTRHACLTIEDSPQKGKLAFIRENKTVETIKATNGVVTDDWILINYDETTGNPLENSQRSTSVIVIPSTVNEHKYFGSTIALLENVYQEVPYGYKDAHFESINYDDVFK